MKRFKLFVQMVGPMLVSATTSLAGDAPVHVPHTEAAKTRAELIALAERAVSGYASGCAKRDVDRLAEVTTDDLRLEYTLNEPGAWLVTDATTLLELCGARTSGESSVMTNVWIYPTSDAESVFVQYDAGPARERQLMLVELRDERISRIVSFGEPPADLFSHIATRSKKSRAAQAGDKRPVASSTTITKAD